MLPMLMFIRILCEKHMILFFGNTAQFVCSVGDAFSAICCLHFFRLTGSQTFRLCHCI